MAEESEWQSSSPWQQGTVKAAKYMVNNGGDQVEDHAFDQSDRASSVTNGIQFSICVMNAHEFIAST